MYNNLLGELKSFSPMRIYVIEGVVLFESAILKRAQIAFTADLCVVIKTSLNLQSTQGV